MDIVFSAPIPPPRSVLCASRETLYLGKEQMFRLQLWFNKIAKDYMKGKPKYKRVMTRFEITLKSKRSVKIYVLARIYEALVIGALFKFKLIKHTNGNNVIGSYGWSIRHDKNIEQDIITCYIMEA